MRLEAPSEALIRRGAILLEDALRTASVPEADGGRLLIVRSLFLEKIRGSQSPAAIAILIEERLRHLTLTAVYAEDPAAGNHPVVYFHDEVEPYIRLAVRLARKEDTSAWFWPLAVAAWHRGMAADEALRGLLYSVMQTQAGSAAAVAMVCELRERQALGGLLSALRWQDGPRMLRAFGCVQPGLPAHLADDVSGGNDEAVLPAHWVCVLDHWMIQWGADDARTAWLAAVALIAEKPGRLLDRRLALRIQQAIKQATLRISQTLSRRGERARKESPISSKESPISSNAMGELIRAGSEPAHQSAHPEAMSGERAATTENDSIPSFQASDDSAIAELSEPGREVEASPRVPQKKDRDLTLHWLNSPQRSRYAGIFFLLPVMSRLGISSLLDAAPNLIEFDFPARLLRYVGQRIGIPDGDPVMSLLDGMCGEFIPRRCDFIEPAIWRQGLCDESLWIVRRVKGAANTRALFDGSGRLALGLWRGRAGGGIREFIGGLPIKRGAAIEHEQETEILLKSWLTAMRRWCRRYAQIGLRDLVCRPGRVSATRTHIDMIFDHHHADIRVRKAGLDLDLGWIPWLGRVVLFHYLYGEDLDGIQ